MARIFFLILFCAFFQAHPVRAQMLTGPEKPVEESLPPAPGKEPVGLTADDLRHDDEAQTITATGHVELTQSGRIVRADAIVYDMKADRVTARGNVVLNDLNGDVHFADEVVLSNKMRDGFAQGIQSYLSEGGRFTAKEGMRENGTLLTMRDASYTPCDCEADAKGNPAWQIKAKEVRYDEEKHRVSYKDARFEMFGVPVAWTPYLSHGDGKEKRKSGFLTPQLGYDSRLGVVVTENYYWNIAPDKDATTGVMMTTSESPVLLGQYRQRFAQADLKIDTSATYSGRIDSVAGREVETGGEFRGHLFADARWDIDEKWRTGTSLELAADDQYLRQYDFSSKDVLENEIYAERFSGRNYAVGRLLAFQDVRVLEERTDQPNVLPEIIAEFKGEPNALIGGRWKGEISALGLQRDSGQDMTRVSGEAGWQRRFVTGFGMVSTLDATVRGDAYAVADRDLALPGSGVSEETEAVRVFPQAHLVNSLPLVKSLEKAQILIEPTAALTVAPNIDAADMKIPNEDSQDVQIDASNLFEASRFPGKDGVEDRSRATYGLRSGIYGDGGSHIDVFAGQSHNFREDDNPFAAGSGLNRQDSDYVGQVSAGYGEQYGLNYRFQLSSEDLSSARHELDAFADWDRLRLDTRYLYASALGGTAIDESREQVWLGARYGLTKHWRVRGGALEDLGADPGLRKANFGFDYLGCCLSFSLNAERTLTADVSGDSGTKVTFRLGLKGLGEFQKPDPEDE